MSYRLRLTYGERMAIDWIGGRYSNGEELYKALWVDSAIVDPPTESELYWDSKCSITFDIPENVAWGISSRAQEEGDGCYPSFPCFDDELTRKLMEFLWAIV